MSHKNWEYNVVCQDCGHEEMSKTRDVYRCRFCGSRDVDVIADQHSMSFEEDEDGLSVER
jgi:Zn finger protein HypA/HybF involved in hydrogenase expression